MVQTISILITESHFKKRKTAVLVTEGSPRRDCNDGIRAVVPVLCAVVLVPLLWVTVVLVRRWLAAVELLGLALVRGGAAELCEVLATLTVVAGLLMSAWHLQLLADPPRMFVVGLSPKRFVPLGPLGLLLLPGWFFAGAAGASQVHPVLVEFMWLLLSLVRDARELLAGGTLAAALLVRAWLGVVEVPRELLVELLVGVKLRREPLMGVPALLTVVCPLLAVALLLVVPLVAVSLLVPLPVKRVIVI